MRSKMWYNREVRNFANTRLHGFSVQMNASERKKVEFLSKEAISRVLRAEAEANALRERARDDARERVSACEQACAKEAAEITAKTVAELKARRDTVQERANALITQSREEAGADIEAIQEAASEKMREAVKHIEWELCDI